MDVDQHAGVTGVWAVSTVVAHHQAAGRTAFEPHGISCRVVVDPVHSGCKHGLFILELLPARIQPWEVQITVVRGRVLANATVPSTPIVAYIAEDWSSGQSRLWRVRHSVERI